MTQNNRQADRHMKKAYTLTEIIAVIVILAILAAVSVPMYNKIIKRSSFKEVSTIVNLVKAGAKYYDLRYDMSIFEANDNIEPWVNLRVDKPSGTGTKLTYVITGGTDPVLQVSYDGNLLYTYDLKDGTGTTTADPDTAYLPGDLPHS